MANGPTVTSFGNAGTRTARIDTPAVGAGSGDLIVYSVAVSGADAAFGFGCQHREVLSARDIDGGQPRAHYQWKYTPDDPNDMLVLLLSFAPAIKYTVRIERMSPAGALLESIRDVDYESQDPLDRATDSLTIIRT